MSVWVPVRTVAKLDKIAKRKADRGWKRADAIRNALADYAELHDVMPCPSCGYVSGPCGAHTANASDPDAAFICDRPESLPMSEGFVTGKTRSLLDRDALS